jgi:hypothetical protein
MTLTSSKRRKVVVKNNNFPRKKSSAARRTPLTRRTPEQMEAARQSICEVLQTTHPMTLRGLFYQLVSRGAIPKTEQAYENLGRMLCKLRKNGVVPWSWVLDNTRRLHRVNTFSSVSEGLEALRTQYRRDPWDDQDRGVYVMCEKDAIAGVLTQETDPLCVPLGVVRGFSSQTFLHEIAEDIRLSDKPAWIYYLGDHDPSGLSIAEVSERTIREFAPDAEIHWQRLGVTLEQVKKFDLITRPTKKSDGRAKNFEGESVEVDALSMETLRGLVRDAIEPNIDRTEYALTLRYEAADRQRLADLVEQFEESDDEEDDDQDDDEGEPQP